MNSHPCDEGASSPPSRGAGLARLADRVPLAEDYADGRNFCIPPHAGVSRLSPHIRHRLVLEREAVVAVWGAHSPAPMDLVRLGGPLADLLEGLACAAPPSPATVSGAGPGGSRCLKRGRGGPVRGGPRGAHRHRLFRCLGRRASSHGLFAQPRPHVAREHLGLHPARQIRSVA